jgi:SAM-dependent methyltransferase
LSSRPAAARNAPSGHTHDASHAIDRLQIAGSHAVLDLGCGDGHHSASIQLRRPRLFVNLDISVEQLRALSRRRSSVASLQVCGDALALPFRSGTFDRVICSLVLYLLPLKAALRELHRLLSPGGRTYVRLPMLAAGRASEVLRSGRGARERTYIASHVFNGVVFLVTGVQLRSPFVRHDRWACYVPFSRFEQEARRAGFRIDGLEIDYPRPRTPSIEAWLVKD